MLLLRHKLRPDCSWGDTDPLLWLSFSTWAGLKHLIDLNIAWYSLLNRRFGRAVCEGEHFTFVEAWRVCIGLLNESLNANGMLFEPYFEHSSKWTSLVSHFLTCSQWNKKYWLCWQSSTAFGFAVLLRVWIDVCQRYWSHGVLRLRNLQFLCSLWQRGFFLHVNFSRFKTPPALHSVAKCFAASTQHWRLWKNETSKTAGS